ncbi:universal stress protein A [Iodidimonas nitroreducens]|uniref:Universal stress protein A n=1 Tax=Iodidimonas nitroreducens TaxID=1236968 RepID=A0A5A7N2N2_9PROT|nr:universal stress protein [Iodidimonas nitroreducens]GAK34744.1 universal stress protein family protein [alpha proteobacterium Q-1]GER02551.1 universal stress protein A [Iodidimonas nitroreducens]
MANSINIKNDPPLGPIEDRPRNFVVVVDESEETRLAIRFASGRAGHIVGGGIILFHAVAPADFQHWMAVADRMRDEALAEARAMLEDVAAGIYAYSGVKPEIIVREGQPKEELYQFIKERQDLFALVLAASPGGEPGPLVDYFSGPLVAGLPCPVVIVPGSLDPESIDRLV